jgi:hypothetical protein
LGKAIAEGFDRIAQQDAGGSGVFVGGGEFGHGRLERARAVPDHGFERDGGFEHRERAALHVT